MTELVEAYFEGQEGIASHFEEGKALLDVKNSEKREQLPSRGVFLDFRQLQKRHEKLE